MSSSPAATKADVRVYGGKAAGSKQENEHEVSRNTAAAQLMTKGTNVEFAAAGG